MERQASYMLLAPQGQLKNGKNLLHFSVAKTILYDYICKD